MITEKEFKDFIEYYQTFRNGIDRLTEALCGKSYRCNLEESDWIEAVHFMLEKFVDSHFTDKGSDWIYYYLYEDVNDHYVEVTLERDMFNEPKVLRFHLNSIEELWNFLLTDKKLYFKNV